MKTSELYLAWEDPTEHRWMPVGRLTIDSEKGVYRFVYTKGARSSPNFLPFSPMNDLSVAYESSNLFPLFANRLLQESRPEYKKHLEWLGLRGREDRNFVMLAATGGTRETDTLEVFQCPLRNGGGKYEVRFLSHGLPHLGKHAVDRVKQLRVGDRLFLMPDIQNPYDPEALLLRSDDPKLIIGYCPRYLTHDFNELLRKCGPCKVNVSVERVNADAPLHLKLVCKLVSPWPDDFRPCSGEMYEPMA